MYLVPSSRMPLTFRFFTFIVLFPFSDSDFYYASCDLSSASFHSLFSPSLDPSVCHEVMGPDAMIFVFWMLHLSQLFSLSSFTFFKSLFSSSSLSAIRMVSPAYLRLLIFLLAVLIPAVLHPAWHFLWCTLPISSISRVQYTALMSPFPSLEPVHCSMPSSNCCFLRYLVATIIPYFQI